MKKIFCITMSVIIMFSLVCPIQARAEELLLLESGITEDNVYYEIYGQVLQPNATTLHVTRYVTFKGRVTPPAQLPWQEIVNGVKYNGVLKLIDVVYIKKDDTTTATYTGTLTYNTNQ